MNDVPQDVRDSMVIEAWMLIAERGLEGMSTREVLARTGAPRGSVYHYFPRGRTQLIEQAIDRAQRWMSEQIAAIEAQTPAEVIRGYVDIWRRVLETTDYRAGCAIVGLVSGAQEPDLLARGATAFAAAADGLAARFRIVQLQQKLAPLDMVSFFDQQPFHGGADRGVRLKIVQRFNLAVG